MRLSEIEKRAKSAGVAETWKHTRKDLIKLIQRSEGNDPCFGTAQGSCMQAGCCWREDCLK